MATTELSRSAERDLIDIYLHGVEHFGAAQADRYAKSLAAKIATAADNPSFAVDYSSLIDPLRSFNLSFRSAACKVLSEVIREGASSRRSRLGRPQVICAVSAWVRR
ncbi:type II toxin-antitoxin system RelE/ParE family toxin [Alloyangia pacifica]|uniref:type II toxin-antitoxin system RelE/ParE family toxin n=1 Tax=Alloyangia pacifica TaxID=311180 RepID=UPI000B80625F